MKRLLLTGILFLTGCTSLNSCGGDSQPTVSVVNGQKVIIITATPQPTPVPATVAVVVVPNGSTPLPPEPCIWQPDGSGLSAYSKQPCTPLLVNIRGGMAVPTPPYARDLGDGVNYRVYGGWEDCRYDAAGTTGGCPWTTAGGYPADDPRYASQVGK